MAAGHEHGGVRILLVDAFDSFVYILRQYVLSAGADAVVRRSNITSAESVREVRPDGVLLGPGPGHPRDSGHVELVTELAGEVPLFGVCLGHQAIGMAFGATVRPAQRLMHGKTSRIRHDGSGLFNGMELSFRATRYHSLIVDADTVRQPLIVTARSTKDDYVMAMRHRALPIESVQFHPESICTEDGLTIVQNFVATCATFRASESGTSTAAA